MYILPTLGYLDPQDQINHRIGAVQYTISSAIPSRVYGPQTLWRAM